MKIYAIFITIVLLLTSCSTVKKSHRKVRNNHIPVIPFECSEANKIYKDTLVEISAANVKDCFIEGSDKLLWLKFWIPGCGNHSNEAALAFKYKESINFVPINVRWDYDVTRNILSNTKHPIYYLDRSLPAHRGKSVHEFLKQLLAENYSDEEKYIYSVFIKDGKPIHYSFSVDINEQLLKKLIDSDW